jgi:hypothetical protein
MTAPKVQQWPLLPPLRLAGLALLLAGATFLVEGWVALLLWLGALVFFVLAVIKFAKVWRRST